MHILPSYDCAYFTEPVNPCQLDAVLGLYVIYAPASNINSTMTRWSPLEPAAKEIVSSASHTTTSYMEHFFLRFVLLSCYRLPTSTVSNHVLGWSAASWWQHSRRYVQVHAHPHPAMLLPSRHMVYVSVPTSLTTWKQMNPTKAVIPDPSA